jgi:mannose-1-phosphate guanylyltransferase/mannose-6-phosphate isomerase
MKGFSSPLVRLAPPLISAHARHRSLIEEQLQAINQNAQILLAPCKKDTAPALTVAALVAQEKGNDPILLVMPSDHTIEDRTSFQNTITKALPFAISGSVVTFGIPPAYPETGYGYIKVGQALQDGTWNLSSFVEKPNADLAKSYIESGEYLWNSGLFMLRTSIWLKLLEKLDPAILRACQDAYQARTVDNRFIYAGEHEFSACPANSIDYSVMEHLGDNHETKSAIDAVVLTMQTKWKDIGSWEAVWEISKKDSCNNAIIGMEVIHENCENSLFYGSGTRRMLAIGLKDVFIIETPDHLLAIDKSYCQMIKNYIE